MANTVVLMSERWRPRWTTLLRSGRSTPRESPAVWYPLKIGRIHEKLPGFLTSGSFSATPSQARRPVVCCFVPGNSGGGRAGLTPASLRKFACGLNTRETRIPCRGHQCAKIVAHRQSFGHPSRLGLAVQSDLSDDLFCLPRPNDVKCSLAMPCAQWVIYVSA